MDIPFKVNLQMFQPSLIIFLENALFLVLVLIMPLVKGGMVYFYMSYLIVNIPGFIAVGYLLQKKFGFRLRFSLTNFKWLFKDSFSLYLYVLLAVLFQQIDTVLLKMYSTKYALGIYSAATRLAIPIMIIPTAIIHTVFPILSSRDNGGGDDDKKNRLINKTQIVETTFKALFIIPVVLAIVFSGKPDSLVSLVFGKDYVLAASATVILLWGQIFSFHSFFVINLLVVYNEQKWGIAYGVVTVLIDFILCLYFIPTSSYVAAAGAKAAAFIAGWILTSIILKKNSGSYYFPRFRTILWSLLLLLCAELSGHFPLGVFAVAMVLSVIILTVATELFSASEIRFALDMFHLGRYSDMIIKIQDRFSCVKVLKH